MKRILGLIAAFLILCQTPAVCAAYSDYSDVPDNDLGAEVWKAARYGLMNGFSDTVFGYSAPITRAQFITVLDRMLWSDSDEDAPPLPEAMELSETLSDVRRAVLGRAVMRGVADSSAPFDGEAFIDREEMAELLVKALGLNDAALALSSGQTSKFAAPFTDLPEGKEGYASIAYAIGMVKGAADALFHPDAVATRAHAAAMLVRVYERLQRETTFRHAFLSTGTQLGRAGQMDVVSLEWSRLTWNAASALLTATDANQRPLIPDNYQNIVKALTESGVKLHLSVSMSASEGAGELLADSQGRARAVEMILRELMSEKIPYSGVTIRFEGLRKERMTAFTTFVSELKDALSPTGKNLYVCVAPYASGGRWDNGYDCYDCRALANVADKLILMAYGYDARNLNNFLGTKAYQNEAPAPADNVYLSLSHIQSEVSDASKLLLDFHFRYAAWKIGSNGKLIFGVPSPVSAEALEEHLRSNDTQIAWDFSERMPYAIYRTSDGTRYFVWYENAQSVLEKTEIARLLGVTGVSYSPLVAIPDN